MPVQVVIDTISDRYFVQMPGYFKIWVEFDNVPHAWIRFLFFRKALKFQRRETNKRPAKSIQRKRIPGIKELIEVFQKFIKCIRIKKLDANIDTGDYPLNALLIPVAQKINNHKINVLINFQDINSLSFVAETQLFRIIIFYIKSKIITKN